MTGSGAWRREGDRERMQAEEREKPDGMQEKAMIFDIKEFAVHDGPGVRTTVFFKGCPLRCVWCHNPEGLSPEKQLMTKTARCRGCGLCRRPCSHEECRPYGRCLYACPDALIRVCGREYTADELTGRLVKGKKIFKESGGGVTFSGGEPLMQHLFLREMLNRMRAEGIHTAIETSGYAPEGVFAEAAEAADLVIMDIKLADPELHRRYTGADNRRILRNAACLKAGGRPHIFRTPLIPGITDTAENLEAVRLIVGDSQWEQLPYNELAGAKYPMLDMTFTLDVRNPDHKMEDTL